MLFLFCLSMAALISKTYFRVSGRYDKFDEFKERLKSTFGIDPGVVESTRNEKE